MLFVWDGSLQVYELMSASSCVPDCLVNAAGSDDSGPTPRLSADREEAVLSPATLPSTPA